MEEKPWGPKQWCVYNSSTRTNNHAEGYHNRLNIRAQNLKIIFYKMPEFFHDEAKLIPIYRQLITEEKLIKYQKKQTKGNNDKLFKYWTQYIERKITTKDLLKKVSHIKAPSHKM